jgi:hypothetical protein
MFAGGAACVRLMLAGLRAKGVSRVFVLFRRFLKNSAKSMIGAA